MLAALGGWERERAAEATTDIIVYSAKVNAAKQQLQALAARNPAALVDLGKEKISVQLALSRA